MKKFLPLLLALVVFALPSCSSDKKSNVNPGIPSDALYDIVTLTATNDKSTTFTVQKDEKSSPVQYFSSVSFLGNTDFKPGSRMIIAYSMLNGAQPYTTASISLYGYSRLSNTEPAVLIGTATAYDNWMSEPLKMSAMTITGSYLNVYAQMYTNVNANPTKYILVADESTLDKDVVETHLILKSNLPDGANLANLYASFDIAEILAKETCRKIKVNYLTTTGTTYKEFDALKQDIRPID